MIFFQKTPFSWCTYFRGFFCPQWP